MRPRQLRRIACVVIGLGAVSGLAACGTTVPPSSWPAVSANGTGPSDGLSGPTAASETGERTAGRAQTAVSTLTGSASPANPTAAGSGSARASGSAAPTRTSIARAAPIKIGYAYIDSGESNTVLSGIGKGLASADLHGEMEAYADYLNAHGGVLGHKLQMVFYRASSSSTLQSIGQAVCAKETQDDRVDISLDGNYGNVVFPCMTKARIPDIYVGIDALTLADYRSFPYVIEPDSIAIDRLASIEVPQLVKMGYRPSGLTQKLGILYYNDANTTAGFNALKSAWALQGVKVADSVSLNNWNSVGDLAGLETSVQAAELRFRADGVTHVMCVETNAFICGFFGLYAGSQGYYPRYAYTSLQPLTNILANVSAKSLKGSVFVGWNPPEDLSRLSSMPSGVRSCWSFMNKHSFPTGTGNERDGAAGVCEALDYVVASVTAAGSTDPDALAAAAERIGPSYRSRRVLGVGTGQAGVDVVRRGAYQTGCSCFAYTSPPIRLR
ncbi:MAG TPA: ABC transporter substrate-binding protein [Mycobacteriales bacterium]|nr:ABC transporter substrate-binding protein [Mycobacteriales bacterium]